MEFSEKLKNVQETRKIIFNSDKNMYKWNLYGLYLYNHMGSVCKFVYLSRSNLYSFLCFEIRTLRFEPSNNKFKNMGNVKEELLIEMKYKAILVFRITTITIQSQNIFMKT